MSIASEQNSPESLRLLAAQRHLYTVAKRLRGYRQAMSAVLAIGSLATIVLPEWRPLLGLVGGLWVIVARLFLQREEAKKLRVAATVQEQLDVSLFQLPWNQILVGPRLTPELIYEADRDYKGGRESLKDWYADTGNLPYPLDVFLCQRSNLVWDWRLRQHYGQRLAIATAAWFLLGLIIGLTYHLTLLDYLLGVFIPSLAMMLHGIETATEHFQIAASQENVERIIGALWETAIRDPASVTKEECRQIQDIIYTLRCGSPPVPDYWYSWLRDKFQIDMRLAVQDMRAAAERALEVQ